MLLQIFFFLRRNRYLEVPKKNSSWVTLLSLYQWILNILSIRTTKHYLNFDTLYLMKYPVWPPPNSNTIRKLRLSAFQQYRGLGVADRVFLIEQALAQNGWGCDFREFDGANNIQPIFVIRKSCNNSYELVYMSGKWPELLSSVTSCDLFSSFLWQDVISCT